MSTPQRLADTVFRVEAAQAVEEFALAHGCPVTRAQIAGLRQIATNEPGQILKFAGHQREKEEKRGNAEGKIAFWKLVERLCGASGFDAKLWSLTRFAEQNLPPDCKAGNRPHGSAPPAEHKAYRETRARADAWLSAWQRTHYPAFFQRFCAHYLYMTAIPEHNDWRNDS